MEIKKVFRSVQTLFPQLHDFRFLLKFLVTKITKVPHEKDFNAIKMFKPSPDQVFVDIGSNRGEAILSMLVVSETEIPIVGFEPNPLIFQKLKNYFGQNHRVTVHNFGLGDSCQELNLFVPFYRNWMFDGLSSFKYEAAAGWLKNRLWRFDDKKLRIKKLNCQIRQLDNFGLAPYFIKIDVQGFELEALKGARDTIATYRPILLVESISSEVVDFLEQFDYQFFHFDGKNLCKGRGRLNTYCLTQESHNELLGVAKTTTYPKV